MAVDFMFCKWIDAEETDQPLVQNKLILKVVAVFAGTCHDLEVRVCGSRDMQGNGIAWGLNVLYVPHSLHELLL